MRECSVRAVLSEFFSGSPNECTETLRVANDDVADRRLSTCHCVLGAVRRCYFLFQIVEHYSSKTPSSTSIYLHSSTLNMNAEPIPDEATTVQMQMNQTANEVSNGFSLIDCLNGDNEHNKMVNDNRKAEKKKKKKKT